MSGELSQHLAEIHFCVSSLEATLHRGLDLPLGLGGAHAFAEEIGIAAEVFDWSRRDRIDPVLGRQLTSGWETHDPMSERFDEVVQRGSGQDAIDEQMPFIAAETVKVHLKHIMGKLGANDRTQSVAIAARRGIIYL